MVTVTSLVGTALSPYLLVKSPLLLVALSPAAHHVALAAATVDPVSLIAVATLRRVLTGLSAYGLGYLYGQAALDWVEQRHPRLARLVRLVERLFARIGVALLVVAPAPTVAVLAGAARAADSACSSSRSPQDTRSGTPSPSTWATRLPAGPTSSPTSSESTYSRARWSA